MAGNSLERTVLRVVVFATAGVVLAALLVAALLDVGRARRELVTAANEARPQVEKALRAGEPIESPSIASASLHTPDGKLIAQSSGGAADPAAHRRQAGGGSTKLANALVPAEIVCGNTPSGDSLCIEQSSAPVAARISFWLTAIAAGTLAAILLGLLAAMLVRRTLARRTQPIAATLERAVRDHDYSHRVPDSTPLGNSINALLEQIQERDLTLQRRTRELESANKEAEAFAYAVSHDLRGPLGSVEGFAQALQEDFGQGLDEQGKECVGWIREGCSRMRELIDGLLEMTRLSRAEMSHDDVDLAAIARSIADALKQTTPDRPAHFRIADDAHTKGDPRLLRAVLENLMANAWKFTRQRDPAIIEFGVTRNGGEPAFYVRDNGAGFDATHAARMFRPFQRLHSSREFEGTGIGLATVQKIVSRHGGKAWAEGEVGKGATIYFTTGHA